MSEDGIPPHTNEPKPQAADRHAYNDDDFKTCRMSGHLAKSMEHVPETSMEPALPSAVTAQQMLDFELAVLRALPGVNSVADFPVGPAKDFF